MSGKFVVITGPSASGKSTLVDELLKRVPHSARLITITTRAPRPQEKDGVDYYFVSRSEFTKRLGDDEFFEHADVYGNLYGSSKKVLASFLKEHAYVFAVIDVQGARTLKVKVPDSTVVFLLPGSLEEVRRRLLSERMSMPKEEIDKRIKMATHEMTLANEFDLIIENTEGAFDTTVEDCLKVL